MYRGKKIIAIIPARGGSKGLHRKNIRNLLGKPLVAWSIEQARGSSYIDKVVVSTEDAEIAQIAKKYKADVITRPTYLATDTSFSSDVIVHVIKVLRLRNDIYDALVLLEPTSPLREISDIDSCIKILISKPEARAIVSVARLESGHPEFNIVINNKGFLTKPDGRTQFHVMRRQELKDVYYFEGSIYMSYLDTYMEKKTFYHEATLGYIIPKHRSLEIDQLSDLICAEALLKAKNKKIL